MPLLQKLKNKVANGDNLEKELDLVRNNGLLFLATETKENIEVGLQFFKDSIDYTSASKLIFVDKVVAWSCSMKH